MRHSEAKSNSPKYEELPAGLFRHFSTEDDYHFDKSMPPRLLIPRQLGRACMYKLEADHKNAKSMTKAARRESQNYQGSSIRQRFLVEMMTKHYGDHILLASNARALTKSRAEQYELELSRLRHALKAAEKESDYGEESTWVGFINDLTVQALFNRMQTPTEAALPALSHHEDGADPGANYDVLSLMPSADIHNPGITSYKIQVKSSFEMARRAREEYHDDIAVVCAQEVLDYEPRNSKQAPRFPISYALITESSGRNQLLAQQLDGAAEQVINSVFEQSRQAQPASAVA